MKLIVSVCISLVLSIPVLAALSQNICIQSIQELMIPIEETQRITADINRTVFKQAADQLYTFIHQAESIPSYCCLLDNQLTGNEAFVTSAEYGILLYYIKNTFNMIEKKSKYAKKNPPIKDEFMDIMRQFAPALDSFSQCLLKRLPQTASQVCSSQLNDAYFIIQKTINAYEAI